MAMPELTPEILHIVLLHITYGIVLVCSGIFVLTGFLSAEWNKVLKNKMMLQFALSVNLRMIMNLIDINISNQLPWKACIAIGMFAQGLELTSFTWMFLKSLRKVFFYPTNKTPELLFFIFITYGWGLPILLTMLSAKLSAITRQNRIPPFCYPSEFRFYFGMCLPIGVASLGTIIINAKMYSDTLKNNNIRKLTQLSRIKETKLSTIVCLTFTVTWIIEALFFEFKETQRILFYVYIIVTPCTGFVFIYYLQQDGLSKHHWSNWGRNLSRKSITGERSKLPHYSNETSATISNSPQPARGT